jgi:ADP-dependent NAD(P)H-hydrate dehydratase / NAD(P)H-hydrate epimerase
MKLIKINDLIIPTRVSNAHKGMHGSVVIIGGQSGMIGGALLAARSALLSGAGRVYACLIAPDAPKVDFNYPEIMICDFDQVNSLKQIDCIVIGPGFGMHSDSTNILSDTLKKNVPLVLDADALNLIANHTHLKSLVTKRTKPTVITPHHAEAARLLGVSLESIIDSREASAGHLTQQYRCISVLKGLGTIICDHQECYANTSGNAGLASGGTGDVLAGIIGSLIAQGLPTIEACKTAVYLHGKAADDLVQQGTGPIGLRASEVAIEVRHQLNVLFEDHLK